MRILVLSSVPYKTNGISIVIKNLYANNTFLKEDLSFLFPSESDGEMVDELRTLGHKVIQSDLRSRHPLKYILFLTEIMRKNQYDIVHIHGSSATNVIELLAAWLAKIPVRIIHCHSVKNKYVLLHKLLKPFVKLLCTDRFACSEEAGRFLFGKAKCKVIYNAFEVEKYAFDQQTRNALRKSLNISENTVVVGHVGCMNVPKNQEFLVRVFERYHQINPDSVLLMVGDGETRPNVEKAIDAFDLRDCSILLGARGDVYRVLNAMDCFVFPSLHEGLGIAPIEAQANGLPIISASDHVPPKIKINENFSFLALSQGEESWAAKIDEISKERDPNGVIHVREAGFDITQEIKKLYDLYTNLLVQR